MRRDAAMNSHFLILRERFIFGRDLEQAKDIGAICKIGFSARAKPADDRPLE
jgi:hypothetical protein